MKIADLTQRSARALPSLLVLGLMACSPSSSGHTGGSGGAPNGAGGAVGATAGNGGPGGTSGSGGPSGSGGASETLTITQRELTISPPAGIRIGFTATHSNGEPLDPDVSDDEVTILDETGMSFRSEGHKVAHLRSQASGVLYVSVVVDCSMSIFGNPSALTSLKSSTETLLNELIALHNGGADVWVSLWAFGSSTNTERVTPFTNDLSAISVGLAAVFARGDRGGTALYDAYARALADLLANAPAVDKDTGQKVFRSLLLITDGDDESGVAEHKTRAQDALHRASTSSAEIFAFGIKEGDFVPTTINELATDAAHVFVSDWGALGAQLRKVAKRLVTKTYVVAVCSPRESDKQRLSVHVTRGNATGMMDIEFAKPSDWTGDVAKCDPTVLLDAKPPMPMPPGPTPSTPVQRLPAPNLGNANVTDLAVDGRNVVLTLMKTTTNAMTTTIARLDESGVVTPLVTRNAFVSQLVAAGGAVAWTELAPPKAGTFLLRSGSAMPQQLSTVQAYGMFMTPSYVYWSEPGTVDNAIGTWHQDGRLVRLAWPALNAAPEVLVAGDVPGSLFVDADGVFWATVPDFDPSTAQPKKNGSLRFTRLGSPPLSFALSSGLSTVRSLARSTGTLAWTHQSTVTDHVQADGSVVMAALTSVVGGGFVLGPVTTVAGNRILPGDILMGGSSLFWTEQSFDFTTGATDAHGSVRAATLPTTGPNMDTVVAAGRTSPLGLTMRSGALVWADRGTQVDIAGNVRGAGVFELSLPPQP
jgi:hypothetical protein